MIRAAGLLAAATLLAFGGILRNGFVWDDAQMIVQGARVAGGWMPLGWALLALLRAVFGARPAAFHAAGLAAHWAVCLAFYAAARRVLERAGAKAAEPAALAAALLFCVHPLQSASVAWAAILPDLIAALLFLLAVAVYLSAARRRVVWTLALYAASLLFRWTTLCLPIVLLLLDWWPLRRRAWREKAPFFAVGALAAVATAAGKLKAAYRPALLPAAGCRGLLVFPWKLLWPAGILPVYGLHDAGDTLGVPGTLAIALVAAAAAWVWLGRRRRPAILVAAAFYAAAMVLPLVNSQGGTMFVFPKYGYLACMPFFLLAAEGLRRLWVRARPASGALGLALLTGWVAVSWSESAAWRDSISFWTRALALDPGCRVAYGNLGGALIDAGRYNDAYFFLAAQLDYNPGDPVARDNFEALKRLAPDLKPDRAAFWRDEARDLSALGFRRPAQAALAKSLKR